MGDEPVTVRIPRLPRGAVPVAAILLVAVLGSLFVRLLGESRSQLAEIERGHRHTAFREAADGLTDRLEQAQVLLRRVADAPGLQTLAPAASGGATVPLEPYRELDALLTELSQQPRVLGLAVLRTDGSVLLASGGIAPPEPLSDPSSQPAAARALSAPGSVACSLPSADRLQAATLLGGREFLILVEVSLTNELAGCDRAAAGGEWLLLDDSLDPPQAVAGNVEGAAYLLGAARGQADALRGLPIRDDTTTVEEELVLGAMRISRPGWLLRFRVPTQVAAQVAKELGFTLLLATAAVLLVLVIGLGSSEARARLSYLQRSLAESERQERFLQGVFDAITDVLVVVDPALQIVRANRPALQLYGKDLLGKSYRQALAPRSATHEQDAEGLREVFSSGRPRKAEAQAPGGERVWELAQFPIFAADGTVRGVVEYAVDVTQNRLLQTQLVQSEKLSTLGEMAAGIAHEINNPLGVISMFAQLLGEEIRDSLGAEAAAAEKVRTIEEQAANVGEIVKNLLRFARKSEGSRARYDVREAVRRALAIAEHQKEQRGIELHQELELEPAPFVVGDEALLSQVVLNLIVNARQAMGGSGSLTLRVARGAAGDPPRGRPFGEAPSEGERIRLSVSDTGPGIEPQLQERLFEPFFTTKPVGEGTGLGLSVGFGIVRDQGGCIWLDSEVGVGTTFTIDLPAAPEQTESQ